MSLEALLLLALLLLLGAWALGLLGGGGDGSVAAAVDRLPGPRRLPLVGTAYIVLPLSRSEMMPFFDRETKKYWPIFRTWNGPHAEVQLSEADHVEMIFRSSVNIEKGELYKFLHPWLGTGLLTSAGQKWHAHRKLLTPTFHFKILESFQEVFSERSLELVQQLERELSSARGFDVYPYITLCALDIICETAMGTHINAQQVRHSPYVDAIYDASQLATARMFRPWLHSDCVYALTKDGRKFRKCIDTLHAFTNQVILEKKLNMKRASTKESEESDVMGGKRRRAFLDLLLEANQQGTALTDEELREEVDTFMFEGHDTTSASLCWTLFLLGHHPDVQERVSEEQRAVFGDSPRPATAQDLSQMKYLEMVIKESLRLYPSVPFIMRKLTQDVTVGEHLLPAGVLVTLHIYRMHRNPKYFPHPDVFNPDNFLPERAQGRHPYAYVPFSAGPRNCIGQKFALLEEKTVLSTLLRHYRVRALDAPADVTLLCELVLRPEKGIRLAIERR